MSSFHLFFMLNQKFVERMKTVRLLVFTFCIVIVLNTCSSLDLLVKFASKHVQSFEHSNCSFIIFQMDLILITSVLALLWRNGNSGRDLRVALFLALSYSTNVFCNRNLSDDGAAIIIPIYFLLPLAALLSNQLFCNTLKVSHWLLYGVLYLLLPLQLGGSYTDSGIVKILCLLGTLAEIGKIQPFGFACVYCFLACGFFMVTCLSNHKFDEKFTLPIYLISVAFVTIMDMSLVTMISDYFCDVLFIGQSQDSIIKTKHSFDIIILGKTFSSLSLGAILTRCGKV